MVEILEICVGARVMLSQNIDVDDGLFNSAIGVIKGLIFILKTINAIYIEFEKPECGESYLLKDGKFKNCFECIRRDFSFIDPHTGAKRYRSKFPIKLAFRNIIHKI